MKYEIKTRFKVTAKFEIVVEGNGWSYTVIYGKHAGGYYCCIPDWNIGCEMGDPETVSYNASKLEMAVANWKDCLYKRAILAIAEDLARAIRDFSRQLEANTAIPIEKTITEIMREQFEKEFSKASEFVGVRE